MKIHYYLTIILFFIACQSKNHSDKLSEKQLKLIKNNKLEVAIFAGGCFWCTEAIFLELEGVQSVKPGYIGGKIENPTYEDVCSGETGHVEAIKILFNPKVISFNELLEVFFATHDPTTLNQQGADVGTQYRSEIFYTNENQKVETLKYIQFLNSETIFEKKIVTQVSPESIFYVAEDYHQNYYNQNKNKSYCSFVITPKVEKVKKEFKSKLKK
jgi:peptide-methionine (S)-S-oxide reductase